MPDIVFTTDRHPISAVRVVPNSPQYTAGRHPVRAIRIIDAPAGDVFTPAGFPVQAVRLVDAAGNYTSSQSPITTQPEVMFTAEGQPIEHVCIIAGAASPEVVFATDGRPIDAVRLVDGSGVAVPVGPQYDFGTGVLPSGVSFTRASAAWGFNSTGVLTQYATNAPRFVYDPITGANLGLLVEGARTNSLRNNTMVGAVEGTPGTQPTFWGTSFSTGNGVTRTIALGTEDGIDYIELRFAAKVSPTYIDPAGLWHGWYLGALGIIINTDRWEREMAPRRVAKPANWDDLIKPEFRGHFIMPSPITTGGGYIFVAAQIFRLGEDRAWQYLRALNTNASQYTPTAPGTITLLARGEGIVGMQWAHEGIGARVANQQPLETITPPDTAFEIGAVSILKGAPNPDGAKAYVDFLMTKTPQDINAKYGFRYPVRGDVPVPMGATPFDSLKFVKYDRNWAIQNQTQLRERWTREIRR